MPEEFMMNEPEPKKDRGHLIKVLVIVVLCAVLFGAIGYILGSKKTIKPEAPVAETAIIEASEVPVVNSPTTSTTADVTANWKTYTNDTYGFSFKYPSGWTYITSSTDRDPLQVIVSTQGTINSEADPSTTITLTSESVDSVVSVDESRYSATADYSKSTSTFAGQPATIIQYSSNERDSTNINKIVIFAKDNLTYVLGGITTDNLYTANESRAEFDNILSTFQFTK